MTLAEDGFQPKLLLLETDDEFDVRLLMMRAEGEASCAFGTQPRGGRATLRDLSNYDDWRKQRVRKP